MVIKRQTVSLEYLTTIIHPVANMTQYTMTSVN